MAGFSGAMRAGRIVRDEDETGISGTGVVAEWCEFTDGQVAIRWVSSNSPTWIIGQNLKSVLLVHGHGGRTRMVVDWDQHPDLREERAGEREDPDPDQE